MELENHEYFYVFKKCIKRSLLTEGAATRPEHSAEKFEKGQEGPKISKGTLRPDFQANTQPMLLFLKPMSPHRKDVVKISRYI